MKKELKVLAFFCKRTKRSCVLFRSMQKNVAFFAFFSVLCIRTLHSLRSFLWNVLLGLISHQKLEKKNGKEQNIPFKERKRTECTERKRTQCPTLPQHHPPPPNITHHHPTSPIAVHLRELDCVNGFDRKQFNEKNSSNIRAVPCFV